MREALAIFRSVFGSFSQERYTSDLHGQWTYKILRFSAYSDGPRYRQATSIAREITLYKMIKFNMFQFWLLNESQVCWIVRCTFKLSQYIDPSLVRGFTKWYLYWITFSFAFKICSVSKLYGLGLKSIQFLLLNN